MILVQEPLRYFLQKGLWGSAEVKTPFSRYLGSSTRPPFQHFSVPQDPIVTKNHTTYFPNFPFKMRNFGKFSVTNPKNQSQFSSGRLNFGQKSVLKSAFRPKIVKKSTSPQTLHQSVLQAPILGPSGHTPYQNQSWVPSQARTPPIWSNFVELAKAQKPYEGTLYAIHVSQLLFLYFITV